MLLSPYLSLTHKPLQVSDSKPGAIRPINTEHSCSNVVKHSWVGISACWQPLQLVRPHCEIFASIYLWHHLSMSPSVLYFSHFILQQLHPAGFEWNYLCKHKLKSISTTNYHTRPVRSALMKHQNLLEFLISFLHTTLRSRRLCASHWNKQNTPSKRSQVLIRLLELLLYS